MRLMTAEESRRIDRLSQDKFGVPSYDLMSAAGEAVATAVARRFRHMLAGGVLVVAGKGNNGGDGMVAARRLKEIGAGVRVALLAAVADLKGDAARAARDWLSAGGEVVEVSDESKLAKAFAERPALVLDAIFGTGLNAPVAGLASRAIELVNSLDVPVVALDIASGVNADTGEIMEVAINATVTVTFGLAKFGSVSYPGADRCGDLEVVDIGFPPKVVEAVAPRGRLLERGDAAGLIRPRAKNSHKGMYGHPMIIAGGRGKSGAALIAARSALRMGAGLVTAAIPDCVAAIVAAGQAELMTEVMPDLEGHFHGPQTAARLKSAMVGKTALVVGPGMGVSDDTKQLIAFLIAEGTQGTRPLLIDADGLNALAELGVEAARKARGPLVLTPHPGEMARLLKSSSGEVNANRIGAARNLSDRTGAYVVLKGARSVITGPEGEVYINSTGNPGMGTPGVGDALSGIVGALLGQGMRAMDALALGTFVHGYAADRAASNRGEVGYITGDIIEELPAVLHALAKG